MTTNQPANAHPNYDRCYTPLCRNRPICVPVVTIPIRNWPIPMYTLLRGALCDSCRKAFSLEKFTDYMGSWYDSACDQLRARRKPAKNPFPDDPEFKWEEFIIDPHWDPAPMVECTLAMWRLEAVLQMKGLKQKPFVDFYNPEAERTRPV